eukprot:1373494-Pleurochrysis_carterae.AAC.2
MGLEMPRSLQRLGLYLCLCGVLSLAGSLSATEANSVVFELPFSLQVTTAVPTKLALQSACTPLVASTRRSCHDDTASLLSLTERYVVSFRLYRI